MNLKNTGNAASVEIVHAIRQAGLNPDEEQLNQLSQAISLIVSRDSISEERIRELIREAGTSLSHRLCEFYFFRHPVAPKGFEKAHGQLLAGAASRYPEAWNYLQSDHGQVLCVSEKAWQAMSKATFATLADGTQLGWEGVGGVPYFSLDMDTGSLRLPDIRGMYAESAGFDSLDVGGVHGDGVRDIIGSFATTSGLAHASGSGAISATADISLDTPSPFPYLSSGGFTFDVSRVHPTGNKVAPRAWGALPCVYLGESTNR